jgi:hypothetical protein
MAQQTDDRKLLWFGADVEERSPMTTAAQIDGFKGVDADVPRTVTDPNTGDLSRVTVRKPAPRFVHAQTTAFKDEQLARVTARYKLMRSAFQFSPADDKELWEERMELAYADMQALRFQQKLDRYEKQGDTRPEQIQLYKNIIWQHRGRSADITERKKANGRKL